MSTPNPYFQFVKNEASREATIYIYGVIGGYDYETGKFINTADTFVEKFKQTEAEVDTIHVRINSPGGYVFEGLAILNAIYGSTKHIITYNDGLCASMASGILLAGDEIKSYRNSLLMTHNSSSYYFGNKKEVEEQLESATKVDSALSEIIQERLNIDEATVFEKYLNYKDNWFTAKEAKAEGFYNEILGKKKVSATPKNALQMSHNELFTQYAAMTFEFPTEHPKPQNTMNKPNSYPQLEAALGLEAPLASNDNGSFLNEDQKATVENTLAQNATAIKTATDAQAAAETALQTATETHATALQTANDATATAVENLRNAATLAGVENLEANADAATITAALTAKIEELNGKPGATHSGAASEDPTPKAHAYVDFNSSIYQN